MKQKLLLFLIFQLFVVPAFSYSVPDDTIVYTTTYGDHYHRSSCGYLHSSRHETTIASAVARGFIACSICRPDIGSYTQAQDTDEQSDEWVDTGYGLLYNTLTEQVKTEDGVIYDDESEALEDMGYTYNSELDMWVGEDGIIQDGEFSAYQELDGEEPEEEPIQEDDGSIPVELPANQESKPLGVSGIVAICFCLCIFVVIPLIGFVIQIVEDVRYRNEQKKKNRKQ